MTRPAVINLLLALALGSAPALAQERGTGWVQCRPEGPGLGMVRGRLHAASGGLFLDRAVSLVRVDPGGGRCHVSSDSTGHFEIRGVPPGTYELGLGTLGLESLSPIPVEVEAGEAVELVIPLRKENWVATCVADRDCGRILTTVPGVERGASPSEALRLAGYRIAMAVAQSGAEGGGDWVACVDAGAPILAALREIHDFVAPGRECEMGEGTRRDPDQRLRHGDRLARAFRLARVEGERTDGAVVHVSYYVAGLWGGGFRCDLVRADDVWIPETCEMTWIS